MNMSELKLPEGSQTQPWLQMLQWALNPLKLLETCARDYGDIFTINIGFNAKPQVIISNPQGIQEIFTTDPKKLDAGNPRILESNLGERYNRPFLGGQSVISFYGDRHKQRRKLLMPPCNLSITLFRCCLQRNPADVPTSSIGFRQKGSISCANYGV